jgi:hypothetical protein
MVFRPARPAYFQETPDLFEQRDLLYHPIKVGGAPEAESGER